MSSKGNLTEVRSTLVQFERPVCFGGGRHGNKAVRQRVAVGNLYTVLRSIVVIGVIKAEQTVARKSLSRTSRDREDQGRRVVASQMEGK